MNTFFLIGSAEPTKGNYGKGYDFGIEKEAKGLPRKSKGLPSKHHVSSGGLVATPVKEPDIIEPSRMNLCQLT